MPGPQSPSEKCRGEALAAKWSEIDWEKKLWRNPVSKLDKRLDVPLAAAALAVLDQQQKIRSVSSTPGRGSQRSVAFFGGPSGPALRKGASRPAGADTAIRVGVGGRSRPVGRNGPRTDAAARADWMCRQRGDPISGDADDLNQFQWLADGRLPLIQSAC